MRIAIIKYSKMFKIVQSANEANSLEAKLRPRPNISGVIYWCTNGCLAERTAGEIQTQMHNSCYWTCSMLHNVCNSSYIAFRSNWFNPQFSHNNIFHRPADEEIIQSIYMNILTTEQSLLDRPKYKSKRVEQTVWQWWNESSTGWTRLSWNEGH